MLNKNKESKTELNTEFASINNENNSNNNNDRNNSKLNLNLSYGTIIVVLSLACFSGVILGKDAMQSPSQQNFYALKQFQKSPPKEFQNLTPQQNQKFKNKVQKYEQQWAEMTAQQKQKIKKQMKQAQKQWNKLSAQQKQNYESNLKQEWDNFVQQDNQQNQKENGKGGHFNPKNKKEWKQI